MAGRAGLDELVVAAGAEMPEPAPVTLERVRDVAVSVRDAAGDDRGVLEVRAVPGEVLFFAAPVHQHRVHAHHLDDSGPADLQHRLPAVPGRFAAHHDPCKPGTERNRQSPINDLLDHPWVTVEHLPAERDRVVIGDNSSLLRGRQIDAHDRQIGPNDRSKTGQLVIAATVTARERPTVTHSILLSDGWSATRTIARGMLRVVDPDSTSTRSY